MLKNFDVVHSVRVYGYGSITLMSRYDAGMFLVAIKRKTNPSYYSFKERTDAENYFYCIISDALPINQDLYIKAHSRVANHELETYLGDVLGGAPHIFKISSLEDSCATYLWHGTTTDNMCCILKSGFKLPQTPGGKMFGAGIYFANRIQKSLTHTGKDVKCLLICAVDLGKSLTLTSGKEYHKCPEGYDSIYGAGRITLSHQMHLANDGFTVGKDMVGKIDSELEYDEYVVYDPKQIMVKYVIVFPTKHQDA